VLASLRASEDSDQTSTVLTTTEKILAENVDMDRPVVSESGIETPHDIRRLKAAGAEAFLVGSSIMKSSDVGGKVRELVNA